MKKKGFAFPSVFLDDDNPINPGEGNDPIGYGTLTGNTGNTGNNGNAVGNALEWEAWKGNMGYQDLDADGAAGAWNDYVAWWQSQGFSPEQFVEMNGTDFSNPRA